MSPQARDATIQYFSACNGWSDITQRANGVEQ